jgi:hypothetical protein
VEVEKKWMETLVRMDELKRTKHVRQYVEEIYVEEESYS